MATFSFAFAALASCHCLILHLKDYQDVLPLCTFLSVFVNSLVGFCQSCSTSRFERFVLEKAYATTSFLQTLVALPFLTTQVWLVSNYDRTLAWLHSGLCVVPLLVELAKSDSDDYNHFRAFLIATCCMSLTVVALEEPTNPWSSLAAVLYACMFFAEDGYRTSPKTLLARDLQNVFASGFCYVALRALKLEHDKATKQMMTLVEKTST